MSGAPANTTDDISSKVALLRALILPVADVTTILTNLVFIVSKGSIESSKFAKLIAFVIILAFWRGSGLISKSEEGVGIRWVRTDSRFR
jgi:lipopolysaccharide export LptBFGC system permease protein LptF